MTASSWHDAGAGPGGLELTLTGRITTASNASFLGSVGDAVAYKQIACKDLGIFPTGTWCTASGLPSWFRRWLEYCAAHLASGHSYLSCVFAFQASLSFLVFLAFPPLNPGQQRARPASERSTTKGQQRTPTADQHQVGGGSGNRGECGPLCFLGYQAFGRPPDCRRGLRATPCKAARTCQTFDTFRAGLHGRQDWPEVAVGVAEVGNPLQRPPQARTRAARAGAADRPGRSSTGAPGVAGEREPAAEPRPPAQTPRRYLRSNRPYSRPAPSYACFDMENSPATAVCMVGRIRCRRLPGVLAHDAGAARSTGAGER